MPQCILTHMKVILRGNHWTFCFFPGLFNFDYSLIFYSKAIVCLRFQVGPGSFFYCLHGDWGKDAEEVKAQDVKQL